MNSANETLQAIRNKKAMLTKQKDEAIAWLYEAYNHDMEILNKEEKKLMEQFKDIPRQEEEKKE